MLAHVQSMTALALSSPLDSSARWTDPQASEAVLPFIVNPPGACMTAAPRIPTAASGGHLKAIRYEL